MRVLHLSHSDIAGGAARGAYGLHCALIGAGISSRMMVRHKRTDDPSVFTPDDRLSKLIRYPLGKVPLLRLQHTDNTVYHSANFLPSNWAATINQCDADVINIHWVGGETLSIEDIGRIRKPIVFTLRDMWPFSGAEHYSSDDSDARWRAGYSKANRDKNHRGLDIDRWVWMRKRNAWKVPMHIVCLSNWLGKCAQESALMRTWPITVIPNTINIDVFKPLNKMFSRLALSIPADKKVILFGAFGGAADPRKGHDLLIEALKYIQASNVKDDIECIVFGRREPENPPCLPFKTRWMGHINDDVTLALLYNSADVMVVPSLQESFGKTAAEPQACGCPVVAFGATGLTDVVEHCVTGYLAKAYSAEDLAKGILWVISNNERGATLSASARAHAVKLWAPEKVVSQYVAVYQNAVETRLSL